MLGGGLASVVEHAGARPSAEHVGPGAPSPGQAQVGVGVEEPGVGVLLHEVVDLPLGRLKAALGGLGHAPLDGHPGVVVDVDLSEADKKVTDERRNKHSEIRFRRLGVAAA